MLRQLCAKFGKFWAKIHREMIRQILTISHPRRGCSSVVVLCYMCPQLFSSPQHPCSTLLYVLYTCTRMSYMSHNCSANADHSPSYMPLSRPSVHLVVPTPPVVQLHIYMYWCTVNRTFHRANPSTLKHFIRQFFSFPIVSYGVCDGESYKEIEYLFIFVPYLSVLKMRE